jgi:hypothetical protein
MYKISVPIMASTVKRSNREKYLNHCREGGIHRIFLCTNSPIFPLDPLLEENVAYFKSQGFEVGIWTDTIGHGGAMTHVEDTENTTRFQPIVNLIGKEIPCTNCPSDPAFRAFVAKHIAKLAKMGVDVVMLDDDFRTSIHGGDEHLCCACPTHMARISEIVGENVTREEISPYLTGGKPNKYRDAWLASQNEYLIELAREIRAEVDKESPDVTVCFCTPHCSWNVDNLDIAQAARILAGKNRPILRTTGAPYWATSRRRYSLPSVFEIARMFSAAIFDEGFELMSEGDVYPRPRYVTPAAQLDLFDGVMRADGSHSGILKYMFDYTAGPDFETGYLKFHKDSKPFYDKVREFFPNGANTGVKIVTRTHTMKDADLDLVRLHQRSPRATDGALITACGIPTVYRGEGICNSVFGESALDYNLSELKKGTVLDSVAAVILTERGVDVGLASYGAHRAAEISFLTNGDPECKSYIESGNVRAPEVSLKSGAEPLLYSAKLDKKEPFAYRYENENGERFFVFLFDGNSTLTPLNSRYSGICENYVTQKVLIEVLPWVSKKNIPAYCTGNPNLYLICEKEEDSLSVGLFNCFTDYVLNPEIVLDEEYSKVECFGCDAEICGNKVILKSRLHAFSSAVFKVSK